MGTRSPNRGREKGINLLDTLSRLQGMHWAPLLGMGGSRNLNLGRGSQKSRPGIEADQNRILRGKVQIHNLVGIWRQTNHRDTQIRPLYIRYRGNLRIYKVVVPS